MSLHENKHGSHHGQNLHKLSDKNSGKTKRYLYAPSLTADSTELADEAMSGPSHKLWTHQPAAVDILLLHHPLSNLLPLFLYPATDACHRTSPTSARADVPGTVVLGLGARRLHWIRCRSRTT